MINKIIKWFGGYTVKEYNTLTVANNELFAELGRYKQNRKRNFESLVEKQTAWRASQDNKELFQRPHSFIKALTDKQYTFYKGLNKSGATEMYELLRIYHALPFMYRKESGDVWESPKQLIKSRTSHNNKLLGDCDSKAFDMYYFFKVNAPTEIIKLQVVNTILEKHMNLLWFSEYVKDWVTIETTIWENTWDESMRKLARHQYYSTPLFAFDNVTEYKIKW